MGSSNLEQSFGELAARQWQVLVTHALIVFEDHIDELAETLAKASKSSKDAMRRKILAIRSAGTNGMTSQDILAKGQSEILSLYAKARRNGSHDPQRLLAWRVSRSLADAIQCESPNPDCDEPIVNRIARLLQIETSEQLWEFWYSVFSDLSDAEIKNLGGMWTEKDAPRKRKR